MKNFFYSGIVTLYAVCCAVILHAQAWIPVSPFAGGPRTAAVGFSIGSYGYIGTGYDSSSYKRNIWKYNPSTNVWTQVASLGGVTGNGLGRDMAFNFVIAPNAYIGTGQGGAPYLNDVWQYSSTLDFWTQKATFPGTKRRGAVAFTANGNGYVCTGQDSLGYTNDCWEYNATSNSWAQKANFIGSPRRLAVGFAIGSKGYVGTGDDGTFKNDFYEYDPASNIWLIKAFFPGTPRYGAAAMVVNGKAYVGCGYDNTLQNRNDFWEYDPSSNLWTQIQNFAGSPRANAVAFAIGNIGYLGTGYDGTIKDDVWRLDPAQAGVDDASYHLSVTIYPNPAVTDVHFSIHGVSRPEFTLHIFSVGGKMVREEKFNAADFTFERTGLGNGIYFYKINSGNFSAEGKLMLVN